MRRKRSCRTETTAPAVLQKAVQGKGLFSIFYFFFYVLNTLNFCTAITPFYTISPFVLDEQCFRSFDFVDDLLPLMPAASPLLLGSKGSHPIYDALGKLEWFFFGIQFEFKYRGIFQLEGY